MSEHEARTRQLREEGWCVVPGVIPAGEVEAVRDSVEATVAERRRPDGPPGIGHLTAVVNYDQCLTPYLAHPGVTGLVRGLLGQHIRISFTTGTINYPGNLRGGWHADWPFNQTNAAHIPAPYGGAPIKLSSLWMLSEFSPHTGGTLVVPGSHRAPINPSGGAAFDREAPHPSELQIAGPAGSVMLFDSRLWHCVATNHSDAPRVAMNIGYAPWWLNLEPTRKGSPEYQAMVVETGGKPNETPLIPAPVFAALPTQVQALVRHWVA